MREVWLKYDPQSGGEGEGDTRAYDRIDRYTNLIGQTIRSLGIDTTHSIGLGFIRTIIHLYF